MNVSNEYHYGTDYYDNYYVCPIVVITPLEYVCMRLLCKRWLYHT